MNWIILFSIVIAGIAGLSAMAARRRRPVGSEREQWTAQRAADDAQTRAFGRGGVAGPGTGSA